MLWLGQGMREEVMWRVGEGTIAWLVALVFVGGLRINSRGQGINVSVIVFQYACSGSHARHSQPTLPGSIIESLSSWFETACLPLGSGSKKHDRNLARLFLLFTSTCLLSSCMSAFVLLHTCSPQMIANFLDLNICLPIRYSSYAFGFNSSHNMLDVWRWDQLS